MEEYLEELGYLAIQRRKLLFSPDVGLAGLHELDDRITAHREGVRLAGRTAFEIAEARLGHPDPWQQYVAIRTWLEAGRPTPDRVLARLVEAAEADLPSWREALRRLPDDLLSSLLPTDATLSLPRVLPLSVDAWGWHGQLPVALAGSLAASELGAVRAAVARAVGTDDRIETGLLRMMLEDADREVVHRALWSAVLRAPSTAADLCRRLLERLPEDPFVVQALGLVGDLHDINRVLPLIDVQTTQSAAIRALGHLGNLAAVEPLLGLLESGSDDLALAASDALESILGPVPLAPEPPRHSWDESGPVPLDAGWAREIWNRRAAELDGGRRWVRGRPSPATIDPDADCMERLWRFAVAGAAVGPPRFRCEVPDGFYAAAPTFEALVGE